jgi:GDP/UDP-N,N'-diacetylbacillosamine 2-epimerase (hydrolysing)
MRVTGKYRICYVSGTRADFGLMRRTLQLIAEDPAMELGIAVTGMHLLSDHGSTVGEIEGSGFSIVARMPVVLDGTASAMAVAIGVQVQGMVVAFQDYRPDVVLLLGDRGEMLAGGIAALHLGCHVVHVHGGERSGTVDEPVRHAISKLSHWHCVATQASRERLVRMGEDAHRVVVTGAPGLDGIEEDANLTREELMCSYGLRHNERCALLLFHPVLQEAPQAGEHWAALLQACREHHLRIIVLEPNSDAGSPEVRAAINAVRDADDVCVRAHMPRSEYLSWLREADVLVGNSSSGIIEAASFGLPVVNVGSRQNLRERSANVFDASPDHTSVSAAIGAALTNGRFDAVNVYGSGHAADCIVKLIRQVASGPAPEGKTNAY